MSTTTTEDLDAEIKAGWEQFRAAAARVAALQAAMWNDGMELEAGVLTGRPVWGDAYSTYWKFVSDEGVKLALGLSGLATDYARSVTELTREYEVRLAERLRADAHRTGVAGDATAGDAGTAAADMDSTAESESESAGGEGGNGNGERER